MSVQHIGIKAAPDEPGILRLNKALADAGVCSRRKADELVKQGAVCVNGRVVSEPGLRVRPATDRISVHGSMISAPVTARIWLLLHKPVRTVSTAHDPQGRQTVLDILPAQWKDKRLFPVGRLDYFSEGLILLTNDGELAHKLLHPRNHVPKTYHVLLRDPPAETALRRMRAGMRLAEGELLAPVRARMLPSSARPPHFPHYGMLLEMVLIQGVNRQIRRMCRDLRLVVLRLARIGQGPLRLDNLPPGAARELTHEEIAQLRAACAEK